METPITKVTKTKSKAFQITLKETKYNCLHKKSPIFLSRNNYLKFMYGDQSSSSFRKLPGKLPVPVLSSHLSRLLMIP